MITKQTKVNQIEIVGNTVQIQIALMLADDENVMSNKWHRLSASSQDELDMALGFDLPEGYPAISNDDKQRVQDIAQAVWN